MNSDRAEIQRIIEGMSPIELEKCVEEGINLPKRLMDRLEKWREEQRAKAKPALPVKAKAALDAADRLAEVARTLAGQPGNATRWPGKQTQAKDAVRRVLVDYEAARDELEAMKMEAKR